MLPEVWSGCVDRGFIRYYMALMQEQRRWLVLYVSIYVSQLNTLFQIARRYYIKSKKKRTVEEDFFEASYNDEESEEFIAMTRRMMFVLLCFFLKE